MPLQALGMRSKMFRWDIQDIAQEPDDSITGSSWTLSKVRMGHGYCRQSHCPYMVLIYLTDLEGDTFLIWGNNIFMILCLMVVLHGVVHVLKVQHHPAFAFLLKMKPNATCKTESLWEIPCHKYHRFTQYEVTVQGLISMYTKWYNMFACRDITLFNIWNHL